MYLLAKESNNPLNHLSVHKVAFYKVAFYKVAFYKVAFHQVNMTIKQLLKLICFAVPLILTSALVSAGSLEQAKRMHDRLAGVPGTTAVIQTMSDLIEAGDAQGAAQIAMQSPSFYNVTIKNWVTPWTNEEFDVFAPLNDYTATVIGMVRDEVDFRQILSGDILYVANVNAGVPAYK
jgi:hypothetical protein